MPRPVDRRSFLGIAAASTLAAGRFFRNDAGGEDLPSPDFTRVQGYAAGIRPYRRQTFRLEAEVVEGRNVVHNYGHGGGGLTVAWGCALEAVELLVKVAPAPREVAVLGAGVLGLSTAAVLLERGYRPVIHAARFSPDTTSDVAGGQWAASLISVGASPEARARFDRIQRRSLEHYRSVLGVEYGVFIRDNYVERSRAASVLSVSRSILPPTRTLDRLPFANVTSPGRVRETLLVEPPIYLPRLTAILKEADVPFVTTRFDALEELLDLPQCEWINCLGAGAGALFDDDLLVPVRGQLVLLEPQDLPWLLSHRGGYVFPRTDAVVLGGTVERGVTDPTPVPESCDRVLRRNRSFFEG